MNVQSDLFIESSTTFGIALGRLLDEAGLTDSFSLLNPRLLELLESGHSAILATKARAPHKWSRTLPEGPLVDEMRNRVLIPGGRRHSHNARKTNYKNKECSYGTVRMRITFGLQQAALLQSIDPELATLDDLQPWHLAALYVQAAVRNLKHKTFNCLGVFWRDALPALGLQTTRFLPARNEAILKRLGVTDRYVPGAVDRSFTGMGESREEMICTFAREDAAWGAALRVGDALQLRPREMVSFHPKTDHNKHTGRTFISHGPKGGRPRHADFAPDPAYVERAVAEAIPFANPVTGSLIPVERTRKQHLRRGYYLCQKHGYTKRERGVTLYGFRREGLPKIYQQHAGALPPICGGSSVSQEAERRGRQAVASHAGHSMWRNSDAYLGPSQFRHPVPERTGILPTTEERRMLRGPYVRRRKKRRQKRRR